MSARANRTGVYELPETPELEDLFRVALRKLRLNLRTNTVGTVIVYNPATQKATVTVDILQIIKVFTNPVDPNATLPSLPAILKDIPVAWPRSGTGYLTFPLMPGDTGEILIQDRSIQQWLLLGAATDPVLAFTHALQDGVFHPGLHADTNPITPPTDLTAAVLHHDTFMKLGRAAALGIARLTDKTSADTEMALWIVQVTAAIISMAALFNAAAAPMASAPGSITTFPAGTPSDFGFISTASTKAKAE